MSFARGSAMVRGLRAKAATMSVWIAAMAFGPTVLAEWTIEDVVLQPGGVVQGRLVPDVGSSVSDSVGIRRVLVLHEGRTIAEAGVDAEGRFALQRFLPGTFELAVDASEAGKRHPCRLWAPGAAPPGASAELRLPDSKPVVRAQGSLLTMGFRRAAAVAGIAGGAIAAPVIHHNIRQDHKAPHSP